MDSTFTRFADNPHLGRFASSLEDRIKIQKHTYIRGMAGNQIIKFIKDNYKEQCKAQTEIEWQ